MREIEVSVLGNEEPIASIPGEIVPGNEFYDYAAKYEDGRSQLIIPAVLAPEQVEAVRDLAVRAFRALDCAGLARVDFLMAEGTAHSYINEINTMPGFTRHQHVSQTVGSQRYSLARTGAAAGRSGPGTLRGSPAQSIRSLVESLIG